MKKTSLENQTLAAAVKSALPLFRRADRETAKTHDHPGVQAEMRKAAEAFKKVSA